MAEIYSVGGTEHALICGVREAYITPFEATDWTDLRVGWFLSLTDDSNDDLQTGLTETIGTPPRPQLPWTDRLSIGLVGGTGAHDFVFCGYTNAFRDRTDPSAGTSKLVSSDTGITNSPANYWRPTNELSENLTAQMIQNSVTRAATIDGSQIHFPQTNAGGNYCTLLALRFTRLDTRGRAKIITMQVPKAIQGAHSADLIFTNTPTNEILESELEGFPTTVQTLGPVELSHVPNAIQVYWPFAQSRIRVHAFGILKMA